MLHHPHTSRRAALGAGLASLLPAPPPARVLAAVAAVAIDTPGATAFGASPIAASAAPGVAARATPDPILPAIEAARAASEALTAALAGLDEADPVQLRRADEAADRSGDARNALARVQPTTWAGFRALVRFHAEDTAEMEPDAFAALALQDIATALDALPPAPD